MYARIENIEEECLDWESRLVPSFEKMNKEITEVMLPSVSKHRKMFLNEIVSFKGKVNVKRNITNLFDENLELSLLFSIVTLPYIVGFLVSYFLFYYYGGMQIDSFMGMQEGHLYIEAWSIGAYFFITVGVIWALLNPYRFLLHLR